MRGKTNFVRRFNLIWVVQMSLQKYFAFVFSEIDGYWRGPASIAEGRIAIVTTREAGCGGRDDADRRAV
jgi:hypothetical protein